MTPDVLPTSLEASDESQVTPVEAQAPVRFSRIRRIASQDWIAAAVLTAFDVAGWVGVYGATAYIRGDAFYVTPLQFGIIVLLQIAGIVVSLVIIGGYSRHTDMLSLAYATEHFLALVTAAAVMLSWFTPRRLSMRFQAPSAQSRAWLAVLGARNVLYK